MPAADKSRARTTLLVLLLAALALVLYTAWPIAVPLFLGAVIAVFLAPWQYRLTRALRGRRTLAGAIMVALVLLVLVAPLAGLSTVIVKEALEGAKFIFDFARSEGVAGVIAKLPGGLQDWATRAVEYVGDVDALIQNNLSAHGGKAASVLGAALGATGSVLIDLVMMLIALFFLLVQGEALLKWIDDVSPLTPQQTRELFIEFKTVSYAVIVSTAATAGVQALAALAGYLIAGVPHPIFFTGLTFIVALIPAIGAASVCLLAALILLVTGHPYMAAFLAVWGVVVVGLSDNVVKPYLMKGEIEMAGAVVFFSLIGGIAAFGMIGVLVGPLAVALFLALLRMYRRDYGARA